MTNLILMKLQMADNGWKPGAASSPTTFEEYKAGSNKTGEIIGYDYGPDKVQPEYSYIEGDLTEGYRNDRVSDYSRSFMFLNLEDKEIPAATYCV